MALLWERTTPGSILSLMRYYRFTRKVSWNYSTTIGSFQKSEGTILRLLNSSSTFCFSSKQCFDPSSSPATLGMSNMLGKIDLHHFSAMCTWPNVYLGVFLLVLGGVVVGLFLLIVEIIFKRHKKRLENESELSRTALVQWRKVKVRRWQLRDNVLPGIRSESQN